jgi:hypothetical protein
MLFSQQAVYMYIRRIVVSSMLTEAWVYTLEIRSLGVCLKDIATITIWVNNLLLFASSDVMMTHMKDAIKSEWTSVSVSSTSLSSVT